MQQIVLKDVEAKADELTIKGRQYHMRIYTAYDVCYFEDKYGAGFFIDRLKKSPTSMLSEIAYRITEGLQADYPTIDDFRKVLDENETRNSKIIEKTFAAVGKFLAVEEVQPDAGDEFRKGPAAGNGKGNLLHKALSWIFKRGNKAT
jgi:hypothetical protein